MIMRNGYEAARPPEERSRLTDRTPPFVPSWTFACRQQYSAHEATCGQKDPPSPSDGILPAGHDHDAAHAQDHAEGDAVT